MGDEIGPEIGEDYKKDQECGTFVQGSGIGENMRWLRTEGKSEKVEDEAKL